MPVLNHWLLHHVPPSVRVLAKYSPRSGPIRFTRSTRPSNASLLAGPLSTLIANSLEAEEASLGFQRGLTTTYPESLQRPYYRAALLPAKLRADSFTPEFKEAVVDLADTVLYLR